MSPPRILIVEDETALADVVGDYLVADGMHVDILNAGTDAAKTALAGGYDLVILDLMLPGVDGLSICRTLRQSSDVPIIMTTARVEEIDRLLGLELGADDYVCKPYSPRELVARVRAVLRRRRPAGAASRSAMTAEMPPATPARLQIDAERWRAHLDGVDLELTRRELALLAALVARPGRVFSRDQLLTLAFSDNADVFDRTIDSHIRNIRRKINASGDWDPIRSVYGVGYAFDG